MRWLLTIFIFCTGYNLVPGKDLDIKHLTVEDGLPSSTVYQALQDKDKYIWFCTAAGVVRYDGIHMVTDKSIPGFTDYGAFHALNDSKGRVWFIPFNGKVCYYEQGRFHRPSPGNPLAKEFVKWIYERNDTFWFTTRDGNFIASTGNHLIFRKKIFLFPVTTFAPCGNGFVMPVHKALLWVDDRAEKLKYVYADTTESNTNYTYFCAFLGGNILLNWGNALQLIKPDPVAGIRIIKKWPILKHVQVFCTTTDKAGNVWIPTERGLWNFTDTSLQSPQTLLAGKYVLGVLQDHESNYWISTLSGVYYLKNYSSTFFSDTLRNQSIVRIFCDRKNQVYFVNSKAMLYRFQPNGTIKYIADLTLGTKPGAFCQVLYSPDSSDIVLRSNGLVQATLHNSKLTFQGMWIPPLPFYKHGDTAWYYSMHEGFSISIKKGVHTPVSGPSIDDYAVAFLLAEPNGNIWFKTKTSLILVRGNRATEVKLTGDVAGAEPLEMIRQNDSTIWVSTAESGIYCLRHGRLWSHYTTAKGLPSNKCNNLLIEDQYLWIATPNGLCHWKTLNGHLIGSPEIFNSSTGLLSNDVLCVFRAKNRMFISTSSGVSVLDQAALKKNLPPPSVHINWMLTPTDTFYETPGTYLAAGTNYIQISYSGISYASGRNLLYKYSLHPINTEWQFTTNSSVLFNNLAPGTYTFQVHTRNGSGIWSTNPASITFSIDAHWWETKTFYALIILLLITGTYIFVLYRIRVIKQLGQLQKRAVEYELNALRAQMNPHFVFNSLNSIQDFILDHKPEEANYYLTRFASLMRMILDYSKKECITLQQEIDFLNLYLELEKLRFSNGLEQKVIIDLPADYESLLIPPMLVQPLVENAIKYALFRSNTFPSVTITFAGNENNITVTVEDNGPGRDAVKKIQEQKTISNHESVGLKNVENRLAVLAANGHAHIIFEDIIENGTITGTRAIIHLPIIKQMEI